ncbi:hypothetical protein DH86_00001600 [Scytalidium sp. 3C]|nr:hypothetical protein DH86_00001600 [Scytalidium sp. 3C]
MLPVSVPAHALAILHTNSNGMSVNVDDSMINLECDALLPRRPLPVEPSLAPLPVSCLLAHSSPPILFDRALAQRREYYV